MALRKDWGEACCILVILALWHYEFYEARKKVIKLPIFISRKINMKATSMQVISFNIIEKIPYSSIVYRNPLRGGR